MDDHPDVNGQQGKIEEWSDAFYTHIFGPKENWTAEIADSVFLNKMAIRLFCQDYRFPPRESDSAV